MRAAWVPLVTSGAEAPGAPLASLPIAVAACLPTNPLRCVPGADALAGDA